MCPAALYEYCRIVLRCIEKPGNLNNFSWNTPHSSADSCVRKTCGVYREYPGLLLEGNFTSDSATNSKDLLFLAKNAFKDLSNPERNYSLTFIDISSLRGYEGQRLEIGTSIQLDVNEYVEEYGDLSQALSQFLFISDISYDLRKDSDINLTVNIIKYQDKLIQRLAKLIK